MTSHDSSGSVLEVYAAWHRVFVAHSYARTLVKRGAVSPLSLSLNNKIEDGVRSEYMYSLLL
jgi:hypothetical protein